METTEIFSFKLRNGLLGYIGYSFLLFLIFIPLKGQNTDFLFSKNNPLGEMKAESISIIYPYVEINMSANDEFNHNKNGHASTYLINQTSNNESSSKEDVLGPIDKGNWLLGGFLNIKTFDNDYFLDLNTNVGYFIFNNYAVGMKLNYFRQFHTNYEDEHDSSFGPFLRAYFDRSHLGKIFIHAGLSMQFYKWDTTNFNVGYGAKIGYALFISPNVAAEFAFGYEDLIVFDAFMGFNCGFQIHLN